MIQPKVNQETADCCTKVIMSGVNGNVIMSGCRDDNPDDEGRETARDNTKSVSRGGNLKRVGAKRSGKMDLTLAFNTMIEIISAVGGSRKEPLNSIPFYKKIRVLEDLLPRIHRCDHSVF